MRSRLTLGFLVALAAALAVPAFAVERPEYDALAKATPAPAARDHMMKFGSDAALREIGTVAGVENRFGVPTFVWAGRPATPAAGGGAATLAVAKQGVEAAARSHVARLAPLYGLAPDDVAAATLRRVHDTGKGAVVATFGQTVGGVEVFRDELKLLMNRNHELVAASGYIPSQDLTVKGGSRAFKLAAPNAIAAAIRDFAGTDAADVKRLGASPGGFDRFEAAGFQPVRVKKVLFHLPGELRPAYYLELWDEVDAYAYVVSAEDGGVLFRHNLTASDSYSYRVWANTAAPRLPFDAPAGESPSPHPTGTMNFFNPPYVSTNLLTIQNGPISTNDPWLPPAATETTGNNVDAYVDLSSPDGFSAGDFRASITSPGAFDRAFDPTADPTTSTQRMAAITQLFYTTNFLHDWFYDVGFDEASGNAQNDNYGRGGVAGDRLRAEAQDFSGTNNANMSTPTDGGPPRMQMYVFTSPAAAKVTITAPGAIAGDYAAGVTSSFGPRAFSVSGDVVLGQDGTAPTGDGCQAIVSAVAGKIALIDRGTCTDFTKVLNAQNAGAIGVILAHNMASASPPAVSGSGAGVTIPVLSVTLATGNSIKAQLGSTTVTATLLRNANRDGTIDNQIVAHEWGHYISNRLIGNALGLSTNMSGGMGEGWGDITAMMLTVRAGDDLVPNNANFNGIYAPFAYAVHAPVIPGNAYYFGFRRYPYSTDLNKNPLTYRHIQESVALPVGPPVAFGASGVGNSEVHNSGEIWCTMLWECYASLLRDTGRLTFQQAQDRMRSYLVLGYKMTPNAPTFLEARDAVLAAAYANDPADFALFCAAFAKRGAGTGAVSPDRYSNDNIGVVESFACGGDLAFVSATITDDIHSCDHDGYLDNGETGTVLVTLRNAGATTLSSTSATVSSTNPAVSFPAGASASFVSSSPFGSVVAAVPIRLSGAVGQQVVDVSVSFNDPGLLTPGPRVAAVSAYGNVDEVPSATETVEEIHDTWTRAGNVALADEPWRRSEATPLIHRFFAPDVGSLSDHYLISPPLQVAAVGSFSFQFDHRFAFESDISAFYDGGVIELSTNGGGTWADIGASAVPGYGGSIFVGANNPISGRPAYVGQNTSYPAFDHVTVNLGSTFNGQTVLVRFRIASDEAVNNFGWELDNLAFANLVNLPFLSLVVDPTNCTPLSAGDPLPTKLSFAVSGANPARGEARFRFALPEAANVEIALYDVAGRRLATLAQGNYPAGYHSAAWNGAGADRKAGVYFARMITNGQEFRQRVVMVP